MDSPASSLILLERRPALGMHAWGRGIIFLPILAPFQDGLPAIKPVFKEVKESLLHHVCDLEGKMWC